MRQLGQRVGLIHELRELGTTKEISNDRAQRLRIDELLRGHSVDIDVEQRHALLDQALSARQTNPALVREQFADRTDAATAQMVDVVQRAFAAAQID